MPWAVATTPCCCSSPGSGCVPRAGGHSAGGHRLAGREILIRGKGKRRRMPLPVDVGEALVDYLRNGRTGTSRALFVAPRRRTAPSSMLRSSTPCCAGLSSSPGCGTPELRRLPCPASQPGDRSAEQGASLDEVGDVLRRRSRMATTILPNTMSTPCEVLARPWPEPVASTLASVEQGGV
jgi:hypothetical protein